MSRRWARAVKDRVIYRLDQLLDQPPIVQVALVVFLTLLSVVAFSGISHLFDADERMDPVESLWWTVTRFLDGGTMALDGRPHRMLSLLITGTGILVVSLLTAFLSSKMGERLTEMRSGMNAVIERGHVLCLGFDANVPLLAREIARSGQRCTLVILANEDKSRIEIALRPAQATSRGRLRVVVRTGEPRSEQALLRVAAHRARKVVVLPPSVFDDAGSVRWTLGTLLSLRRVVGDDWRGRVLVLARHEEAVDLLGLAIEPGVAGANALAAEIIAIDAVVAGILAQSTRQDGVYDVLRHLLAFDGCELYRIEVPSALVGRTFDAAHAAIDGSILVGIEREGAGAVSPARDVVIEARDWLVVMGSGPREHRLTGKLDGVPPLDLRSIPPPRPESVTVVGCTPTLPHLLSELSGFLPDGSRVRVVLGESFSRGNPIVLAAAAKSRIEIRADARSVAEVAHPGEDSICASDAVVILGTDTDDGENGDASALASLLRLRRGIRLSGSHAVRVVTEVRDPRSAAHIAPRPGDCIVSSDVVAMLLAQELLDERSAGFYREILHPGGAYVSLRPRERYLPPGAHTFGALMAAARAQGDVAVGLYPDPRRPVRPDAQTERQRLEEGDPMGGADPWLNPPRSAPVPDHEGALVVVLTHRR